MKRKFLVVTMLAVMIIGTCSLAVAATFNADVIYDNGDLYPFTLSVVTYNGPVVYDQVQMEWWQDIEGGWRYRAVFNPNAAAVNWKVIASPSGYFIDPVIIDGDQISPNGNMLNDEFHYIGPTR